MTTVISSIMEGMCEMFQFGIEPKNLIYVFDGALLGRLSDYYTNIRKYLTATTVYTNIIPTQHNRNESKQ